MATSHGGSLAVALQDLQHIFGERLLAMVGYGHADATHAPSLALVQAITSDDLDRCAARAASWHRAGCATPLLLTREEFAGSLDTFPIEYGEILQSHDVIYGVDPFAGLTIRHEDMRRACEVLVKSHLVHLRENIIESRGRQADIRDLVYEAAPGFAVILRRLAQLDGRPAANDVELSAYAVERPGLDARTVGNVLAIAREQDRAGVDVMRFYPAYVEAVERLWLFIDRWK